MSYLWKGSDNIATCIMNEEIEPRRLDLAFLGYTTELSRKGLKQFAENNKEQILEFRNNLSDCELYLVDGTRIKAVGYGERLLHGYKFDQLILFDDDRWEIKVNKDEVIRMIKNCTMYMSNVPEEYQILYYEDII
jgi:hypothetical protein